MAAVRSFLFVLIFYGGTVPAVLLSFPISLFGTRAIRWWAHVWARYHRLCARFLLGVRTKVEGTPPRGACLVACKHQSMFETLEMMRIARTPIVVIKRQLSRLPGFGWATRRYGVIPVDREAGAKALREMLVAGKEAVATGRPVLIYPEGTRVRSGETPPLQAGFAGLYKALGMPVVPVAMDSGRFWGRNLPKGSGTVRFLIGEPIPAGLKRDEIEARVHAAINALELAP